MRKEASSRSKRGGRAEPAVAKRRAPRNQQTGEVRRATTPEQIAEMIRAGNRSATGAAVTADSAMRVAAVFACVRVLADSVAMLPLRLYEGDGDTAVLAKSHRVDRLIRRPNAIHTAFEFRRFAMACLLLRGNAYFYRYLRGSPREELLPFDPARMTPKLDGEFGTLSYEYQLSNGTKRIYKPGEVLHLRALSVDGVVGLSVLSAAREAVGLAMTAERHGGNMFSNGASPGGVLKHPAQLSKEAATRLRDSFDEKFSGTENAHRTLLLEEGMTWEKVAMTAEEAQFIDARKFQRSEICMFFGVPPHMVGDVERGTSWGSGIEQQGLGFVLYTLLPWLTSIEQACERDLMTPEEGDSYNFMFDTDVLTRADFLTRQEGREIQLRNGVISPNEWRRGERMNPRTDEGGDAYADHNAAAAEPAPAPQVFRSREKRTSDNGTQTVVN